MMSLSKDARLRPIFELVQQYWEPKRPKKRQSKEALLEAQEEYEEDQGEAGEAEKGNDHEEGEEEEETAEDLPVCEGEAGNGGKVEDAGDGDEGNGGDAEPAQNVQVGSPLIPDEQLLQSFGLMWNSPEPPNAFFASPKAPVLQPQPRGDLLSGAPPPEMTDERLAFIENLGFAG